MMDLISVALRGLIVFAYLLAVTRASGKRVVAEATPFDLVVSIIIAELISGAIWAEVPAAQFVAATGSVFVCHLVTKMLARHSRRFHKLVDGIPRILIRDGKEDRDALRREQLNEEDLKHLLRRQGVDKREEVRLGIIERDHDVSLLKHSWAEAMTKADADRVRSRLDSA